jgi:hypothetical protein
MGSVRINCVLSPTRRESGVFSEGHSRHRGFTKGNAFPLGDKRVRGKTRASAGIFVSRFSGNTGGRVYPRLARRGLKDTNAVQIS